MLEKYGLLTNNYKEHTIEYIEVLDWEAHNVLAISKRRILACGSFI
jgi:hypothetical protein